MWGEKWTFQIQEAPRIPNRLNPGRTTLRHTVIKLSKLKDKERILRVARERSYEQGNLHKTISEFLNRNLSGQERMGWFVQNITRK